MLKPTLTYLGDHAESLVGRVMGPDTAGGFVRCVQADYDTTRDVTLARFEPALGEVVESGGELSYCAHPHLERGQITTSEGKATWCGACGQRVSE